MPLKLLCFLCACANLLCSPMEVCADERPNFLFILTDDQSPETLSAYGNTVCETPNIDRLAAEGMVLHDAHHMGAWIGAVCTPSRTMIMTGRTVWHIPGRKGKGLNHSKEFSQRAAETSMPAIFNAAGYKTFRTCKRGNSFDGANQLFQVSKVASKRGGTPEGGSQWHGDQVMDYLKVREANKEETPFLIYFGLSHPHDPRNALPELAKKYGADNRGPGDTPNPNAPPLPVNYLPQHPFHHGQPGLRDEEKVQGVMLKRDEATIRNELGREYACIENIDIQVGRVLKQLKATGELDNTYVIFTSDHGIAVGRHGLVGKQNLYEHTWRVPMIVRGPGIKAGSSASGYVYLLDVLPTLCDYAGITPPEEVEGKSFRPVLEGKQERMRDVLYGVYCGGTKPGMRSVKTDGWKLIEYDVLDGQVRETQLFNLKENPHEFLVQHQDNNVSKLTGHVTEQHQTNLADDPTYASKRKEMETLLKQEMTRLGDPYELSPNPPVRQVSHTRKEFDREKAVLEENRIPWGDLPEKHQTHASTITEANDGTLVAAWFAGTKENHPDVKIWASRKVVGKAWSKPQIVDTGNRMVDSKEVEFACWNPVLITHPDGTIYLYYKITGEGKEHGPRNWWGAVRTSKDAGATWSERIWLPTLKSIEGDLKVFAPYSRHLAGPIKNRPLIMPDGSLLCGSSTETTHGWRVHFELYQRSDWTGAKHGAKVFGPLLEGKEGIQPSFLIHSKDMKYLQVLTREDGSSRSYDGGRTWSQVVGGPINTSKGLHAVTLENGWSFLAFNPEGRSPLSLARTRDGKTWETVLPELNKDGKLQMDYPTIIQSQDGKLHIVHSYGRQQINHLVLDTDYLSEN